MFSHTKFQTNSKFVKCFLSSLSENTGHTRLQQQSISYRKKLPWIHKKRLKRRGKKKEKKDSCKAFWVTFKRKNL